MGDSTEQWRATIGRWSGGRPAKCEILQHCIAETSNHIGYRPIRYLVLISLLVIGCIELNPGPDHENAASSQTASAPTKFQRRRGTDGQHGVNYEIKMAKFLFVSALHKTEEFYLASNFDGVGAFDDLVFRYRLREPDVWKTCFIQLKHKKKGGTIHDSDLKKLSGNFSLLKYYNSYREIKEKPNPHRNLKQCGPFVDFEFVIYTNAELEGTFPLQGGETDQLSILSSGTDCGKYVSFDETREKNILDFFKELSKYHKPIRELDSLLKERTSVDKEINKTIEKLENISIYKEILGKLNSLKSGLNTVYVSTWIDELAKFDFNLFKEFLNKVKIFHSQSHEKSLKGLIEEELQHAFKASPPVANFMYTKIEKDFSNWWEEDGDVEWLNKNSELLKEVQKYKMSVGRKLGVYSKYYVPRVLQHHVYLKEDILKLTDYAITFAVSGLQAEKLKKYLPAGKKICEFVYDERERVHTLKTVSDFSNSGFSAECGSMKHHQNVGQKMKSDEDMYNKFGNNYREIDGSGVTKGSSFGIATKLCMSGLSDGLEDMIACNEAGQNTKPEEVRYIVFGNKNPDSEFRELKKQFRNVHWIHVEGNDFLWRDTNGNIVNIRWYIDDTKCRKYDKEFEMEQSERTMLLVAEPGMGKSTFLTHMEHEIKKRNAAVWVLRINLNEHTSELKNIEFEEKCIDKCKEFLWSVAHSPEQDASEVQKKIFLQALEETGEMVIILDGFDEISPDYSSKVQKLIRAIRDETDCKIWVSSRLSYRQQLEDIMGKFALTLQPFTTENQIQFLEQYWSEVTDISDKGKLQMFAKMLLSLCSENFNDKEGEFTGIPLQTMMLGEAFVNEVKEYCSNENVNLREKFNLLTLFETFWDKKCDIYFSEKIAMDSSKQKAEREKESYLKLHMTSALISLYSLNEVNGCLGAINDSDWEQSKTFLQDGTANDLGIITDTTDGKPHFIHRYFAEYFAAKWFTDNLGKCEEFISNNLFNPTNELTRNIFDRMLAKGVELHGFVLYNDIPDLKELLKKVRDINALDKGGRTALHLAASYNRPYIQELLTFPGIDTNKRDAVMKWTPLSYAEGTMSWMAMDILLQNGANSDDIVIIRNEVKAQEWGQAALWECASKGHMNLLEFMMNCGIQVNEPVEVPENLHDKRTLLHRATYCGQVEVVRLTVNRGADINIRDANSNTALHLAAESGSVNIINLLLNNGMSVNVTDPDDFTPLHVSAMFGHLEATKTLVDRGAAINNMNKHGATPLMMAAFTGKLEIFNYLTELERNYY